MSFVLILKVECWNVPIHSDVGDVYLFGVHRDNFCRVVAKPGSQVGKPSDSSARSTPPFQFSLGNGFVYINFYSNEWVVYISGLKAFSSKYLSYSNP